MFTYALIEPLHKGDTNGNGKVEVGELAEYVDKRVPELFAELKQNGWVVKGLAPGRGCADRAFRLDGGGFLAGGSSALKSGFGDLAVHVRSTPP